MKYWRKFDIEFETTTVFEDQKSCFDAVFIPTKNNNVKIESLLKHLQELDIAKKIFVISTSVEDVPQQQSQNVAVLYSEFVSFLKEYNNVESAEWDLPLKRNFAISFSKQNSFEKILLLDDDVRFNDKNTALSLCNALEKYWISSCYSIGEIDTSLIGAITNEDDKFFSGNCLGINVEKITPFFSEIYNEDYLAILPAIINHKAILAGRITQLTREITDYRKIAHFQEFGELITDDIYEHISLNKSHYSHIADLKAKLCDLSYWERVIKDRTTYLTKLDDFAGNENQKNIIIGAKEALSQITPEKCVDFLETWLKQENEWIMYNKKKSMNDSVILIGECEIHPSAEIADFSVIGKPYRRLFCGTPEKKSKTVIKENVSIGYSCIVGNGSIISENTIFDDNISVESYVSVGKKCLLTYKSYICSSVQIGDNCVIGGFVCERTIIGNNCRIFGKISHSQSDPTKEWDNDNSMEESPIIFDNVFIGMGAIISAPVKIGPRAYVCAGSIITKDVPEGYIAYGVNNLVHYSLWKGKLKDSKLFTSK